MAQELGNWFLGLVVPEAAGLHQLTASVPAGVRRFQPADLHLTVAFLGPCGEAQARQAWDAIAPLRHGPIAVRPSGWRALGRPGRPSAYALTLGEGATQTAALIETWGSAALRAAGRQGDRRPALPHITLARPSRAGGDAAREAMEHWLASAPVPDGSVRLDELGLYRWADQRDRQLFTIALRRRLDHGVRAAWVSHWVPGPPGCWRG